MIYCDYRIGQYREVHSLLRGGNYSLALRCVRSHRTSYRMFSSHSGQSREYIACSDSVNRPDKNNRFLRPAESFQPLASCLYLNLIPRLIFIKRHFKFLSEGGNSLWLIFGIVHLLLTTAFPKAGLLKQVNSLPRTCFSSAFILINS